MNKLKPVLLLLLVFLAGIAVGVVGTRLFVRQLVRTAVERPEQVRLRVERRLERRLDLTPEQQARVHEILTNSQAQIQSLRREFRPQMAVIVMKANRDIMTILTPEQQRRYKKMRQENPWFWRSVQSTNPPSESAADSN